MLLRDIQDNSLGLQAILAGEIISFTKESLRQGQRERALAMLHQMIADAHQGKRQFLSGMLVSCESLRSIEVMS